jgi:hypothetical protein
LLARPPSAFRKAFGMIRAIRFRCGTTLPIEDQRWNMDFRASYIGTNTPQREWPATTISPFPTDASSSNNRVRSRAGHHPPESSD